MYKLVDLKKRRGVSSQRLNEISQSLSFFYAWVYEEDDEYEQITPFAKCRDYASDVVWGSYTKVPMPEIYGFKYPDAEKYNIMHDNVFFTVSSADIETLIENLGLLNYWENLWGFAPTSIYLVSKNNIGSKSCEFDTLLLNIDKRYYSSPVMISAYTYILRLLTAQVFSWTEYSGEFPERFLQEVITDNLSKNVSDYEPTLRKAKGLYGYLYKHWDVICPTDGPLCNFIADAASETDVFDMVDRVHNSMGVYSFASLYHSYKNNDDFSLEAIRELIRKGNYLKFRAVMRLQVVSLKAAVGNTNAIETLKELGFVK